MTVYRNNDRWDRSNVLFRGGRIHCYSKKQRTPQMQHIDYGIGVLRSDVLERYAAVVSLDLEEIYRDLVSQEDLAGFEVKERFYEIGSPEGLKETRAYLAQKAGAKGPQR